jgi:hypothetical protein
MDLDPAPRNCARGHASRGCAMCLKVPDKGPAGDGGVLCCVVLFL